MAHLWLVWREAAGLPSQSAYPQDIANPVVDPWVMVGQQRESSGTVAGRGEGVERHRQSLPGFPGGI
jgi:hypothetical protein